ncbi:MAG: hypothetical protein H0X16_11900 [Chloroflexi bacterium]|nr:hypothetical protein [Chloroflexota bacterium]
MIVVVACITGQPSGIEHNMQIESPSPSRATRSGATQAVQTQLPAGIRLSDHWWYRLDVRRPSETGGPERIAGFRLSAGLFDGRGALDIERDFTSVQARADFVAAEPFAAIAGDEALTYGFFDGQRSQVWLADVLTGDDDLLYETDAVVHFAAFDERQRVLYYVVLDLATRRDNGVWRLALGQPNGRPEQVIGPSGANPREDGWFEQLWLAGGGARLVVRDCNGDGCRIQVADTATGRVAAGRRIKDSGLEVYGVTGEELYFDGNCQRPCPISALSLTDGRLRDIGNICQTAVVVEGEQSPTLLYERCPRNGRYEIVAHELSSIAESVVYESRSQNPGLVPQSHGSAGFVAPPGWFLVGRDNSFHDQAPSMVNATNGEIVELPHLGQ